jgi:D-beta-D-heptose 7-phosphate kinase/D-beta-D-heptose 1-phosphate adenosyltransferase
MKILVIGDNCVDVFRYGEVERLAPEAPIPVIVPDKETSNAGMAGNVVANLKALGGEVDFITNKIEIRKIRYVCSKYNHLLLRVDENDKCEHVLDSYDLENLDWGNYDAVVISDYCKGFLNEKDIEYISKKHPLTFLDSKKILSDWANNITFIKINNSEWLKNKEILNNNHLLKNKTIITKGKYGCVFKNDTFPTKEVPVKDVSGAGDTFLSGLVVEYLKAKDIKKAINFAQECTTIVVQKSGVSTI